MIMERRQEQRRQTFVLVEIDVPGQQRTAGLMYNRSAEGAFVLTKSGPQIGQKIYLRVPSPAAGAVRLQAQVAHRNQHGLGLVLEKQSGMTAAA